MELLHTLPNPFQIATDPVSLIVLAMYGALMLWEFMLPARALPKVKYWKIKGLIAFLIFFYLSSYLPLLWDGYLGQYQLFNLSFLGTYGGAAAGILIYEFGLYLWHRAIHKNNALWKIFHQMHHSAERIDSYGAFFFSPLDMVGFTFLGSLSFVVIAGFTPEATTLILLITTFLAIFQHSNIKTPVWMGYIVQRPEAHSLHHAKNIHAFNYSDLALFDIIFGTFKNPENHKAETGFYQGASGRIKDMLLFRDISNESENSKAL